MVARENQSIGAKAPATYLDEIPENKRARTRALASHLIPHGVGSGLRDSFAKRDYQTFLDVRTRLIAKTFEAQAGVKLFRRD